MRLNRRNTVFFNFANLLDGARHLKHLCIEFTMDIEYVYDKTSLDANKIFSQRCIYLTSILLISNVLTLILYTRYVHTKLFI